jgi:hypothetical protein
MVYCKLISQQNNVIRYAIGALYNDLTGILVLNPKTQSYEIEKQPNQEEVYEHFIDKMLRRYQKYFDAGEIPEKMSYEI